MMIVTSLMSLFLDFSYFLSGKFLKIIIWVTFYFNLLACCYFHFMFSNHLSFNLNIWIIIWWFWYIINACITSWWILDYDDIIMWWILIWILLKFFVVQNFLSDRHFAYLGRSFLFLCLNSRSNRLFFSVLYFGYGSLLFFWIVKIRSSFWFHLILLAVFTCICLIFLTI